MKSDDDRTGINWQAIGKKRCGPTSGRKPAAMQAWRTAQFWRPESKSWVRRVNWGRILSLVIVAVSSAWVFSMMLNLVTYIRSVAR